MFVVIFYLKLARYSRDTERLFVDRVVQILFKLERDRLIQKAILSLGFKDRFLCGVREGK